MNEQLNDIAPFREENTSSSLRVIVIGAGPVGIRFADELFSYIPDAQILVCSNEPYKPYNRVQLSAFLSGDISREQLDIDLPESPHNNLSIIVSTIQSIDKENKSVTDSQDQTYYYDKLVIATGAKAYTPGIEGSHLTGVYTFRNLKDAEHLYARVLSTRHIVIAGGGLLGCEAAKALRRYNTNITLIQQGPRLMNKQLDDTAASLLQARIEELGIRVITGDGVRHIYGENRVEGIDTRTGEHIECDTLLFCAGISPNIKLAKQAKLHYSTGITVSDHLVTSDPNIYAIGECCEHQGKTYGLVNPGFEQTAIAANHIAGQTAFYPGSLSVSRLKVVGEQVCSIGEVADLMDRPLQKEITFKNKKQGVYRKLVFYRGDLIGALGIGEWPEMSRIQEAFMAQRKVPWWRKLLFKLTGRLWAADQASNIRSWPENALVCQCNAVDRGQLSYAMEQGCSTVACLQKETQAGTVCGSCKPLLEQLCANDGPRVKEFAWLTILVASLVALSLVLFNAATPELAVADSVQTKPWFESIWNDSFFKQVTGFSLLGLTLFGLIMSLRKRLKFTWLGQYEKWRLVHILLGVLCAVVLIFHTGFHFGENLNRLLIMNFIAILILGSSTGLVIALSDKFSPTQSMTLKKVWSWLHILVSWPLPALLAIHILTVYYF